ncbi:protein will decrease acetylation-like isoform X2 [Arctopsyche grandis]
MAVSAIVDGEAGRSNSILFSCINNDPVQCEQQFTKLVTYIKSIEPESIQNELSNLLCPLLCHMYLEMLRGGHVNVAQMFLKRHSTSLPQKDFSSSMCYNHPTNDGNLPSSLYRPNSLEQLFHSLQNGTIDSDIPEKDFVYQILDELSSVSSLQDIELRPSIAAFRSCKYELQMTLEAITCLKKYLAKHSHVILIQVLQTWFHFDLNNKDPIEESQNPQDSIEEDEHDSLNDILNNSDTGDSSRICNGHSDFVENENELRELQEAIRSVREIVPPLKLYTISTWESNTICATIDSECKKLICGLSNSEIRMWGIEGNIMDEQTNVNSNISRVSLACNLEQDEEPVEEIDFDPSAGICLRGHSGPVQALKLIETADKCGVLVSCSQDTSIRAWRMSDKSCAAIYRGHNYPVWCLDVAKHGVYMASGSYDRTAKLWSLDRTFPLRIFAGHNLDINTLSFHPNGNYIATGSADKTVRLWCVSTGQQVRLFPGHRGSVHSLAFSPNGKLIASAGEDKRIKIWDIASGACLHDLKGHQNTITDLEWSSLSDDMPFNSNRECSTNGLKNTGDVGVLTSTSMDATVRLWDSNFYKYKSGSSHEASPTVYNCKCSYVVMSRYCPDWVVAVGAKVIKDH